MTTIMALFSPLTHFSATPSLNFKTSLIHNPFITLRLNNSLLLLSPLKVSAHNEVATSASAFEDSRWLEGTWDLTQFQKNGNTDWDAVIDAEVKRRKWLEDNPVSFNNDNLAVFNTTIIPWWAWIKRFHLPEAELINGRAAMIGFFMAYLVDSLSGVGVLDQTSNFFCKTLLFISVAGILVVRKNEDIETLKKLWEEVTFYDKQWQATWQDENLKTLKLSRNCGKRLHFMTSNGKQLGRMKT